MTEPMVQPLLKVMFWLGVSTVVYVHLLYPVLIWVLAGLRTERRRSGAVRSTLPYSVILAVRDEAPRISARLDDLVASTGTAERCVEVIVVADGCTDTTVALARSHPSPLVRVVELAENQGKARALSCGCEVTQGEIIVFADARQRWADNSLQRLLENFGRP